MINNKIIENELKETEKQIEDLLLRIKELRKEVCEITPKQKVIHEQHHCYIKNPGHEPSQYYFKSKLPDENVRVINYCKSMIEFSGGTTGIYEYNTNEQTSILIVPETKQIIETWSQ